MGSQRDPERDELLRDARIELDEWRISLRMMPLESDDIDNQVDPDPRRAEESASPSRSTPPDDSDVSSEVPLES
jgi:hypothetical protein